MQFKSVMVISAVFSVAALTANGCSSTPKNGADGGDTGITGLDAKSDKVVNNNDSGGDGAACGSGLACEECNVSGYAPVQMAKPLAVVNACTLTQLQAFVTACFSSGASSSTCTAWEQADSGACGTCLEPVLQTSASWGPFDCATSSSPCGANEGGCVDLVLNTVSTEKSQGGAGSCGDLVTINFGCQDYACSECEAPNDTNAADGTACDQSAVANECVQYVNAVESGTGACAAIDGDSAPPNSASCFPQSDAQNVDFVNIFCGTGPTGTQP